MENCKRYEASEIFTPCDESGKIGCGAFGVVRIGKVNASGQLVAVKCFSYPVNVEKNKQEKLSNEATILLKANDKNIVKFYGITTWSTCKGIIMEYMEGGSLDSLLHSNKSSDLPWPLRLRIVSDIANGLSALHSYKPSKALVHGDIKPDNILLTAQLVAKLADFGSVSIAFSNGATSTTTNLQTNKQHTPLYTAPEFLKDVYIARTPSMDIYSFAMVVYETISRIRIFSDASLVQAAVKQLIIDKGQKPNQVPLEGIRADLKPFDQEIFFLLESIMKECWSEDPNNRSKIATVCKRLYDQLCKIDETTLNNIADKCAKQRNIHQTQLEESSLTALNYFKYPFEVAPRPVALSVDAESSTEQSTRAFQEDQPINISRGSFKKGNLVQVCASEEAFERLQTDDGLHGGWHRDMKHLIGKIGEVQRISDFGAVVVRFPKDSLNLKKLNWSLNPASVRLINEL